ncbi:MAG: ATP-dependent RNA helicase [Spirochaetales bacterium]|nr:ATP-dependent RNA helicase [Spirochaetales bacterium]
MDPLQLPVYQQKSRVLEALGSNRVVVVESPTGSGKTTQIPQILLDAGYAEKGIIGVTQPRRIAAVSVADFIARQRGTSVPDVIGYKMRFQDRTDQRTRIKIMTDGILLQEIKADYALSRYSLIMVDEAHERSLNIDFILGLLKRILEERSDFKVVVSSATINAEIFSEYFDGCPIVNIDTPMYPVEIRYEPPKPGGGPEVMIDKIAQIVLESHTAAGGGGGRGKGGPAGNAERDVLIFLPGEGAIKNCIAAIQALPIRRSLEVLPLYARLSAEEQDRVFGDYPGRRKVIVATNIAETSVTIDGITTVVDSGLAKINYYNQRNFTSSLIEVPISKASANQRKGRAGRTRPGICHRLYSRKDYELRPLYTTEEILRTDLSEVVLRMAELGIRDFEGFDFISVPSREGILSAIETLRLLDALDEHREVTPLGQRMLVFPILPRLARAIVEAIDSYPRVLEEVLIGVSFLSTRSPFVLPPGEELEARKAHHTFRDPMGDFLSYLKLFRSFGRSRDPEQFSRRHYIDLRTMNEIVNIKDQLEEIVSDQGIPIGSGGEAADYLCCIARGLIQFVCVRSGRGVYKTATAGRIQIHPGSVMFRENPTYIVAGEIVRTSRTWAHSVSPLRRSWLERISPLLARQLIPQGARALEEEKPRRKRDSTNYVKIGRELFEIRVEKGKKKTVILPWDKIRPVVASGNVPLLPHYQKLRGKLLIGEHELCNGMHLSTILKLIPRIDPSSGILQDIPRGNFVVPADFHHLEGSLSELLRLCRLPNKKKRLGFLALHTDGQRSYWFRGTRNYLTALNESLYSLETLADESSIEASSEINRVYRELSEELEAF